MFTTYYSIIMVFIAKFRRHFMRYTTKNYATYYYYLTVYVTVLADIIMCRRYQFSMQNNKPIITVT